MPTWSELLDEITRRFANGEKDAFDSVRRCALADLAKYTGRNTILYAVGHLQKRQIASADLLSITHEDIEGFMEVIYGLNGHALDLILHSPGGQPDAAEAVVTYLRSKFKDIRVIVPHEAMSAATLIACAADRILMGRHSYLGPVDPQIQYGVYSVPAQAVVDQFQRAKDEIAQDPRTLAVWIPILQQYGPALIEQCENAKELSKELVSSWLERWMFRKARKRQQRAKAVSDALTDYRRWRIHSRPLHASYLKSLGLAVDLLEDDQRLQDLVLTVYHATMHTFSGTPAVKIIENHLGRSFIKLVTFQPPSPPPATVPPSTATPPPT